MQRINMLQDWARLNRVAGTWSAKPQATSNKQQATSKIMVDMFFNVRYCRIYNKSNGAIASVPTRDLLIPLVDRPSHKSDSVRPARGSFSFSKIQAPSSASHEPQASSPKQQASSSKPQAASALICCPS